MCLQFIETIDNKRKFAYKILYRDGKDLYTPYACMKIEEDTTIWQDASKVTELGYFSLQRGMNLSIDKNEKKFCYHTVIYNRKHKGLISVYLNKKDAIDEMKTFSINHEIWYIEIRDKKINIGKDYCGHKCALMQEFRLVRKLEVN